MLSKLGYFGLSCRGYSAGMIRIAGLLLILGTSFDLYALDGKYSNAASGVLYSALLHFR